MAGEGRGGDDTAVGLGARERACRLAMDWSSTPLGPMDQWPEPLLWAIDLIDRAPQPMVITWGRHRAMFYNDAYAPIILGKGRVQGRPIDEVFAEAWDVVGDIFSRAEGGDSVYIEDLQIPLTRAGRTAPSWWNASYSPLPTRDLSVPGVLCVVHETTRAWLAEEGQREAWDERTRMADLVPSLLWKADRFGRTVWQNGRLKALAAQHGADPANLWRRLMHPDDIGELLEELADAKARRRAFSKVVRLCVAPGAYRLHQVRSEPTLNESGDLIGWYGVATDIQEVRDAVEALDDGNALFRQFAENAAAMLWMLDLDTEVISLLSPNFTSVWPEATPDHRWTRSEFLASLPERDRPGVEAGFERAAAGEVVAGKFRVVGPGDLRVLEGTTFPIKTGDKTKRVGGILKDITLEARFTVALIDEEPGSQNRWSHGLRKLGLEVVAFSAFDEFAKVAAWPTGPVVLRNRDGLEGLRRLAGLLQTSAMRRPWLVIQDAGSSSRDAVEIMRLGAADIVEDDVSMQDLASAIRTAASVLRSPGPMRSDQGTLYRLTSREYEIAMALVAGGTNKTIGRLLGISPRTVETHRSRLMERLNVRTLAELVALVTSSSFSADVRA